jgi:hypothetical protein
VQLWQSRRRVNAPVRAADAQVLTVLAQEVEAGAIDRTALAPSLQAKESAEVAARGSEDDLAVKLHAILTPAQRGALVDAIESKAQPHGRFHGADGPDATATEGRGAHGHGALSRMTRDLGLSPDQQQQIASNLRAERQADRAARAGNDAGKGPAHEAMALHRAWLDSFRGDSFAPPAPATSPATMDRRDGHMERVLEAAVPVLTQAQRTELAGHLRARAAHEKQG